jgi:YD repeat-containing protein
VIWTGHAIHADSSEYSSTQFYYDLRGHKTMEVDAAGQVTTYAYDAAGNVFQKAEYAAPIAGWNSYGGPNAKPAAPAASIGTVRSSDSTESPNTSTTSWTASSGDPQERLGERR